MKRSDTMKKMYLCLLLIVCLCVCACAPKEEPFRAAPTATPLPEQMPEDFDIYFNFGPGPNFVETYEDVIQKDLIIKGTAQAKIEDDSALREQLYELVREYKLNSITDELTVENIRRYFPDRDTYFSTPSGYYVIRFTVNGKEYNIEGSQDIEQFSEIDEQCRNFIGFADAVVKLIRETEEYLSLPEAEGGYM